MTATGAVLLALSAAVSTARAQDVKLAELQPTLQANLFDPQPVASVVPTAPARVLTTAVLQAYIARQRAAHAADLFGGADAADASAGFAVTDAVSAYAASDLQNSALAAIDTAAAPGEALGAPLPLDSRFSLRQPPVLPPSSISDDALARYVAHGYMPTLKKVKLANTERRCLSTAIYNEARGESDDGQWAVANVIINRAMSKRFPSTMCGVIYQNASAGHDRCQFSFACDGRPDKAVERRAWAKAKQIAAAAFAEFQRGRRPGVVPNTALFYHNRSVSPDWGRMREVAEIGAHMFYAPL